MADEHQISISKPSAGEAGKTGDWRSSHPEVDASKCSAARTGKLSCQMCWAYCPDACISQGTPPSVDLTYCKGCGICAEECPSDAISMVPESDHGVC